MASSKRRGDGGREDGDPDPVILGLAREIRTEVERISESAADSEAVVEALEAIPRRERIRMGREVFDRLTTAEQWAVLSRSFDDDELRAVLEGPRADLVDLARRVGAVRRLVLPGGGGAVTLERLDGGARVVVGLFTERDVEAALERGPASSTCARRLSLVSDETRRLRVLGDVFNPAGGYFVTRAYDETSWQRERLEPHAFVRLGSVTGEGRRFEPFVYAGGRVDFEVEGRAVAGTLSLGYLLIDGVEVFSKGELQS